MRKNLANGVCIEQFVRSIRIVLAFVFAVAVAAESHAQTLINVRLAGDSPGTPTGAAVIGSVGDSWNYFPNLNGRANGGGVVTNATTIRDSDNNVLSGVGMTMSLSGGNGLDRYTDNGSFSPTPQLIMGQYVYESDGANYFTFNFTGLQPNRTYMLYGMGNGNASGQGTTWWMDVANGHATASASANFSIGDRNATLASNEGICWMKLVATTPASGALTFRVLRLGAAENGSGGSGRAYLNAFQLQLLSTPVISGLTNQTVVAGLSAVLSPIVIATPTPSYQWRSNSIAITGATNFSLTLNNVQYAQNGAVYSLIATNLAGKATNSMTLTVIVTPNITGLDNQAVTIGSTVNMNPTVSGVPIPSLRWLRDGITVSDGATGNGSTISGSASGSLSIINAQMADSATYSLVASNSAGLVTNNMTLTVSSTDVAPDITGPNDQTAVQTSNAVFTASVSGLPLPTFQWFENGIELMGKTNSSLTISNVQYAQNGFVYSLIANNVAGSATNSARLYVLVPPVISQQPTNIAVSAGAPANFSVDASGVPAVAYHWRKNGNPIANATNSTYTLPTAQGADNEDIYSVLVSNSVGTVTSSNALLTVLSTMTGALLPANNSTGIAPDQQLRIVFSGGTPHLGSGKLYVRNAADDSIFATIDTSQFVTFSYDGATVTNGAIRKLQGKDCYYEPIAVDGNEAWITLTNRFAYNKTYYVNADAGLFRDAANASFPAITGTNTWRFATKISGPATPTASTGPTNITVGLDGAGDFATLQGASDWIPQNNSLLRTIRIKPGIYRDYALFEQNRNKITIVGTGTNPDDVLLYYPYPTVVSGGIGVLTLDSSDINVLNLDLDTKAYLTFPGRMRSLITTGNRLVFDHVFIKGGQDTLYTISGSAYFYECEIWGSVDFIYGAALSVFDQCTIVEVRNSGGPITAPNTAYAAPYGLVFLNCIFPRALIADGYPYDVNTGSTAFQRPWGQDGYTAIINCQLGSQFSTKGWSEWDGRETTCRAREYGNTQIGGGSVTPAQRQSAGAYWLNTKDPDYTSSSMSPTDALLYGSPGINNRVAVTVNPADFTLDAIFGNSYFALGNWRPKIIPVITAQPTNKTVSAGSPVSFTVSAMGLPEPTYQWRKNGGDLSGATNATFNISGVNLTDNATYSVLVTNSAGSITSSNAVLTVPAASTPVRATFIGGALNLTWAVEMIGYHVEAQTNNSTAGLGTNWVSLGYSTTNSVTIPINSGNGSVFYRLVYP